MEQSLNIGRKVERIRKLRGLSQDQLAKELNISRQAISRIEQSETVEDEKLEEIATVLGTTVDAIKNFSEDATFNYIQNNYTGSSGNYSGLYHCAFNPLEKCMELFEENKKLFQQLLESERQKVEMLQKLLDKR